jgi:HemY protein
MRRVLLFIAAAAVAVAVAWWLSGLTGEVTGNVSGVQFSTPTPVFITLLAAFVILVHFLLRLLSGIFRSHRRIGSWRTDRRRDAGDIAVHRTLVALAAGEAGDARREAERARRLLGDTPQTLLLAAEARRLAKEDTIAESIYGAMADRPDAAFLGLRGLFRQAVAKEDWAGATEIARRAEAAHPGGSWLRAERAQLAVRSGNWTQALALTGPEGPVADFAAAAAESETDPVEATRLARRAWKANPGFTPAALAYAKLLRRSGKESRALEVIGAAWKSFPHPDLAAFALEPVTDKLARVKDAGRLAERNPDHFESHFLLAKENLAAGLTKVARRHAEAARRAGLAQKRLWLLMADLEVQERGDTEEGRDAQREALRQAAMAETDPAWRCENCGTVQPAWLPACPSCHTAGRIRWGGPARRALTSTAS